MEADVYLRFVFARTRDRHRRRLGILHHRSKRCDQAGEVDEISQWLNRHLAIPPKDVFSGGRALCWFKVDATPCIDKVRDLALLLERGGAADLADLQPESGTDHLRRREPDRGRPGIRPSLPELRRPR